ncbi:MAG: hypothetical protein IJS52_03980 [Bacilli bacterium]|nr:hypothetical protein [Bacilli bacterium]
MHNVFRSLLRSLREVKINLIVAIATFIVIYLVLGIVSVSTDALRNAINALPVAFRYIFSILYALGFVAGGFALTMLVYLIIRRRQSNSKYLVEAVMVFFVFLVSWGFKIAVSVDVTRIAYEAEFATPYNPSMSDITSIILSSFYATLGGFSFEGLSYDLVGANIFYVAFYYGSSIVAGLVSISVIASKAAYEFYSRILLFFLKTTGKKIYIFTALNEETLNLANSLVEEDRNLDRHANLIIFSGSALEPFDRHDPNCVEVLSHGYIYWSVLARKKSEKRKSILRTIGLRPSRFGSNAWESVTVFAFDSDNDHIPNEEENMDYVLFDINNRIARMRALNQKRIASSEDYFQCLEELESLENERNDYESLANTSPKLVDQQRLGYLRDAIQERQSRIAFYRDKYQEILRNIEERRRNFIEKAVAVAKQKGENESDARFKADALFEEKMRQKNRLGHAHVAYYILTKRKIDYQAYQDKIERMQEEYSKLFMHVDDESVQTRAKAITLEIEINKEENLDKRKKLIREKEVIEKDQKKRWKAAMPFSVHVWNESDAIAREAQSFVLEGKDDRIVPRESQTWAWTIGFGATGQAISKAIYCFTSNVGRDGVASRYLCDVFDPDSAEKLINQVRLDMPLAVCLSSEVARESLYDVYASSCTTIYEKYFSNYQDANAGDILEELRGTPFVLRRHSGDPVIEGKMAYDPENIQTLMTALREELPLPCFVFHNYAAGADRMRSMFFDLGGRSARAQGDLPTEETHGQKTAQIFELTSEIMKEDAAPSTRPSPYIEFVDQKYPDYIVIAAGDDYENIRIANSFVRHFQHFATGHRITIFVNIWDDKNNNLLFGFNRQGDDPDKQKQIIDLGVVRLIIVGNNEDIYKCSAILEDKNAMNFNAVYAEVAKSLDPKENAKGAEENKDYNLKSHLYFKSKGVFSDVFVPTEAITIATAKANTWDALSYQEQKEAELNWRHLPLWERVSSAEAFRFAPVFYQMLKQWRPEESEGVFFSNLARIEHQRWMRRHIVDGWIPKAKKDKASRYHNCIVPMAMLNRYSICYDLFNVFLGISLQIGPKNIKKGFAGQVDSLRIDSVKRQMESYLAAHYPRVTHNHRSLVRAYSFGFDEFGEAMAESLFVHSADARIENGESNHFLDNVFTEDAAQRGSIYRTCHQQAIVLSGLSATDIAATSEAVLQARAKLDESIMKKSFVARESPHAYQAGVSYPAYSFHPFALDERSSGSLGSLFPSKEYLPDYILLSLPEDAMVPSYLRAIVAKLLRLAVDEHLPDKEHRAITIFARVFDDEALANAKKAIANAPSWIRVCFIRDFRDKSDDEPNPKAIDYFRVKELLLSSAEIEDHIGDYEANITTYLLEPNPSRMVPVLRQSIETLFQDVQRFLEKPGSFSLPSSRAKKKSWEKIFEAERRTYEDACAFGEQLSRIAKDNAKSKEPVDWAELCCHLARLEHQRYVRSLIADSWTFHEGAKVPKRRIASDLLPLACLSGEALHQSILYALLALALYR